MNHNNNIILKNIKWAKKKKNQMETGVNMYEKTYQKNPPQDAL